MWVSNARSHSEVCNKFRRGNVMIKMGKLLKESDWVWCGVPIRMASPEGKKVVRYPCSYLL